MIHIITWGKICMHISCVLEGTVYKYFIYLKLKRKLNNSWSFGLIVRFLFQSLSKFFKIDKWPHISVGNFFSLNFHIKDCECHGYVLCVVAKLCSCLTIMEHFRTSWNFALDLMGGIMTTKDFYIILRSCQNLSKCSTYCPCVMFFIA